MNIPSHIAIIPDGNRRWAKEKGFPTMIGHKNGFDKTVDIVVHAQKIGVKVITFYAFSTENWNRAKEEVDYLMDLFMKFFDTYMDKFHKLGIKLRHLGNINRLPESSAQKLKDGMKLTENNKGLVVQLALNYGGRDEITRAVKKIISQNIPEDKISEETISQNLDTANIADPDLIIRTSGETRLSGFLLWQSAYSELHFIDKYWPDFSTSDLDEVIDDYNNRQRRFGK